MISETSRYLQCYLLCCWVSVGAGVCGWVCIMNHLYYMYIMSTVVKVPQLVPHERTNSSTPITPRLLSFELLTCCLLCNVLRAVRVDLVRSRNTSTTYFRLWLSHSTCLSSSSSLADAGVARVELWLCTESRASCIEGMDELPVPGVCCGG